MLREPPSERRKLPEVHHTADLAVVGGGLAGVCAAVTAARAGLRVVLVQDRPVLGGNASSEIRMVVCGATASMANNNRFAREGGVIDEFLLENVFRNPQGNPFLSDALLLELVEREPGITLLLDTAVWDVEKHSADLLRCIRGFSAVGQTIHVIEAPLFCDASGDGVVGFLAGAAFRMGAEPRDEFDEPLAPSEDYGHLLGHTLYFTTRDTGRPVPFVRPSFALADVTKITRWQRITAGAQGRDYWWLEYGGRLDTVHDTARIKWELWRIVYAIWDYLKNSGRFPEMATHTLEWVGSVPGKRESRRFEGDVILTQRDVVERRRFPDAVSYGGWSIDLHPADGVYAHQPPCTQWHAKGVYTIPYRALYSRNIRNLFLAGRITSASHVAFGSTRVMGTCAQAAQAVGMAAALCRRDDLLPAELALPERIEELQRRLVRVGQYIPGYVLDDPDDLVRRATITATGRLRLASLPPDGSRRRLAEPWAVLLPVGPGPMPRVEFRVDADRPTRLVLQLRHAVDPAEYTPEVTRATRPIDLPAGADQAVGVDFNVELDTARYVLVCLGANEDVQIHGSRWRVTGVTTLVHRGRAEVTSGPRQQPPEGLGVDAMEFWRPVPAGEGGNLAVALDPPLDLFGPEQVTSGVARPTTGPGAWVADPADPRPALLLRWPKAQSIGRIELGFDTDRDNPLFSVQYEHPERIMPSCVRRYRVLDAAGRELAVVEENHQTRNVIRLDPPVETDLLRIEPDAPGEHCPAAIHEVRCYADAEDRVVRCDAGEE